MNPSLTGHGGVGRVNLPEVDVALTTGHYAAVLSRMELSGHDRVGGTLALNLPGAPRPVPDSQVVLRSVVNTDQVTPSVSPGEGETGDGPGELSQS